MSTFFKSSIFASLALSTLSAGCSAGFDVRPKTPSLAASAELGPATASAYAAPAPAREAYNAGDDSGYAPAPATLDPAPQAYASSGGGSPETAQLIVPGDRIEGRVAKGAPRYYALICRSATQWTFRFCGAS